MMRLIFVLKSKIEDLPPLVTALFALSELGIKLILITDYCFPETEQLLKNNGVDVYIIQSSKIIHGKNIVEKFYSWLAFRWKAWKTIQAIHRQSDILWIGSASTALALGTKLFFYKYILHIHELYDTLPRYKNGLKKYAQCSLGIVVPDMSRAAIFRVWWKLNKTPFIIPNKPFFHPKTRKLDISDNNIKKQIDAIGDIPIILYQGHIENGRTLDVLAKAIHNNKLPVKLVLMGIDYAHFVEHLRKLCPDLIYIGFVFPPRHLEITSHATIGIIQYNFSCLNHVFCAPNKIWEYAGFGIPALVADLPALHYYYDRYNAGICCNFDSEINISHAIQEILKQKSNYFQGAINLFESINIKQLYKDFLEQL
jgi:glycosyltransferase involved in cell wall biosynthesis